jgi:NAD(P)H-hydrate epimerase
MKHIALSSEIAKIDAASQLDFKLPALSLMESAAMGVWLEVQTRISSLDASLVFLCGGGNNGGDALAVARLAYNSGHRALVCIMAGRQLSPSCERQLEIIKRYGIDLITVDKGISARASEAIVQADFLFDGLAGTGLKGPLRGDALALVELANQSPAYRIAIDTPSGISENVPVSSPHFQADLCITFGRRKVAMFHPLTRSSCGEIIVKNPSFPPQLLEDSPVLANL